MFQTRITELFGIEHPVVGGCMMHISGPAFVAAISNAGGMGTLTSIMYQTKDEFAAAIDRPDLAKDARFSSIPDRVANTQALDAEIEPIIQARSTADWVEILGELDLRVAPVLNVAEVMDHSQTRARNMVVTATDPDMGELKMPGNPIKIAEFPDPQTRKPAPDLGRDTEAVKAKLAELIKEGK